MALPKIVSQQAGVDPISVQQVQDQNQKITEILSNIEARLGNVTNVRSNVQMATYDALGNNFLSRGLVQLTDSITDSIGSLFKKPEKERKDPVVEQLEQQTIILKELVAKSSTSNVTFDDDITQLRLDIKKIHELDHADSENQLQILGDIKQLLSAQQESYDVPATKKDAKRKIRKLSRINGTTADELNDVNVELEPEAPEQKQKEQPKPEPKKATTLLQKILEVLIRTNKSIEGSSNLDKISTQEDTLESMQDKNKITDIQPGQRAPKGERDSFLSKLFDKDLNILGLKRILRAVTGLFSGLLGPAGMLLRVIPLAVSAFTSVIGLIKKIPFGKLISTVMSVIGKLADWIPGIPGGGDKMGPPKPKTPAIPKAGGVASKLKSLAKGVGAAAIMTGVVMGADAVAGAAGIGGNEIDTVQDDRNWERASTWEKVQSAVPRGIEHIGSFVGLDNLVNQARSERISNETKYLDDKSASIEQAQKEADKTARLKETQTSAAPQVNFNSNSTTNQTIMPVRQAVKNTDDSFNRYLSSVLK